MDARYTGRGGGGGGGGCISSYGVGGGCISRYVGDAGCYGLYDVSMVDRMMLKFRPIAPRPVASGSGSGGSAAEDGGKSGGGKRRYVRVRGGKRNKDEKKRKASTSSFQASGGGDALVTLSLMPETPDRKENSSLVVCSSSESFDTVAVNNPSSPIWLSFNNNNQHAAREGHVELFSDHTAVRLSQQTASFVTVERVRETGVDWGVVGCTDEQRMKQLERDACPGFISDGGDRVVWRNKAYREMVAGGEEVVVVVRKDGKWSYPAAFTCNVRVVTCRNGMSCSTLTAPCDAWRMEGGYAWRLDVKAALCLGF